MWRPTGQALLQVNTAFSLDNFHPVASQLLVVVLA